MSRLLVLAATCTFLAVTQVSGDGRDGPGRPLVGMEGKWKIEFANDVSEACEIDKAGKASVVEPLRRSVGQVEAKGGSFVIAFADDRVERWTPVGKKFVVEHWFPASQLPVATPVLGIAESAQ